MESFNLLDEPWIDVRLTDGTTTTMSIMETFGRAHEARTIEGEVPTQYAAIIRLLLAILHRATPRDGYPDETWGSMWERGSFDLDPIRHYLAPYWDRFDLVHPVAPFYQVADLHTAKDEFGSMAKLVIDVPPKDQFFTTRSSSSYARMSLAEAARWVVHAQSFDPSGIKSGAVGDARVKGGKGYPIGIAWCGWLGLVVWEGANLLETLLLNFDLRRAPAGDSALWERGPQTASVEDVEKLTPLGPVDLLTWQSRRIRLRVDGAEVTGVVLANGDELHPRNRHRDESMTAWRRSETQEKKQGLETVYMPRGHLMDRALWRGFGALLARDLDGSRTAALPLGTLEWLSLLTGNDALPRSFPLRARAIGIAYGSNSSVVDEIYDDQVSLVAQLLADDRLASLATAAVGDADHAAKAVADLARNLAAAAGARGGDVGSSDARERLFAALDQPYRRWLAEMAPAVDHQHERAAWQRIVRRHAELVGRQLIEDAGVPAWGGRVATRGTTQQVMNSAVAERFFIAALRRRLVLAFTALKSAEVGQGEEPNDG